MNKKVLIHGDAAFAGEGVVQETLNLSQLKGYSVGGTLHVIVNNQIGFTTDPEDARSTAYATDVAKMLQSPIFHVNGEDPEAVAQVVELAMDFRKQYKRDVVIDMYCYRWFGHNEGDEPSFTQPQLYQLVKRHKGVRESYLDRLLQLGEVTKEEADKIIETRTEDLERELSAARSDDFVHEFQAFQGQWDGYVGGDDADVPEVETVYAKQQLSELLGKQSQVPKDFNPLPKLTRILKTRQDMAEGIRSLDWAAAESLAFASLAVNGTRIRMSGQDCERGTFSHRHAVLHDIKTGATHVPLRHLAPEQGEVEFYNSPLSETGVLGFDYGYSLDYPDGLTLWEAQFGDFVNAGQVIIDQFITSGEDKWQRLSGLVMLLPHGFEGSGPEHSSARLERFLNQTAEDNIQVMNLTTPAQYFHALRRQVLRPYRKPLVIMTPKSLLRHPKAVSELDELATGHFQRVIADHEVDPNNVKRILLCTGKLYYELLDQRETLGRNDVAIVRIEQLYPLPTEELSKALAYYQDATEAVWMQEEPQNMGAWYFMKVHFGHNLLGRFPFRAVTRPASASPATGSGHSHKLEQKALLDAAFAQAGELVSGDD